MEQLNADAELLYILNFDIGNVGRSDDYYGDIMCRALHTVSNEILYIIAFATHRYSLLQSSTSLLRGTCSKLQILAHKSTGYVCTMYSQVFVEIKTLTIVFLPLQ